MARTTFKNDMRITGSLTVVGSISSTVNAIGAATATAGAATLAARRGKITTEALTTAQNLFYTLTITNTTCAAADMVMASLANGTNSAGTPVITSVTPGAGSIVIVVQNMHASAVALNGTLVISYEVLKAS